jgi:hypothetical protein
MDEQNEHQWMFHTKTGTSLILKKEGNSDTCYNMDEP